MTTITHTPKYPVVDIAPGMWKVFGNFNATDYSIIAGMTGFGYAYGWFTGNLLISYSSLERLYFYNF